MSKNINLSLLDYGQAFLLSCFSILLILSFSSFIKAQPELSAEELNKLKTRKYTDVFKYHLPQEKLPVSSQPDRPLLLDGDLDATFNTSVTEGFGYVNETLVQPDGKIIVVGLFQRANGTYANGIARFNANGSLDTGFNAGIGPNAAIRTVALQADNKIIVGGAFTAFNDQTVRRIVRLNADGSLDTSFSTALSFNNQINDLAVQPDGKILVAGQFSISGSRLVRLNSDGSLDFNFPASSFNSVLFRVIYTADGKILTGGDPGIQPAAIRRINSDGSPDPTFNAAGTGPQDGTVMELIQQPDGKIIAAGTFLRYNGTTTDGIVRINADGSLDQAFNYLQEDFAYLEVSAVKVQPDNKILVGYYVESESEVQTHVVRFNADATRDTTFAEGLVGPYLVADINFSADGKILVGGGFVAYNNQTRLRLIKLNSDGTADNSFNPAVSQNGVILDIKRQTDGKILIGGDFDYVNGVRQGGIARINTDGTLDTSFTDGIGFYGDVNSIAIQPDGKIVAGGNFISYDNENAYCLARLNTDGSLDANLITLANDFFVLVIRSIAIQNDGKIVAGGTIFNNIGTGFLLVVRLLPNGATDSTFGTMLTNGVATTILPQSNGKIIIGGTFFYAGSGTIPRNGILRLNENGSLDSAFSTGVGNVYALKEQADGQILAGGATLTRFSADGAVDPSLNVGSGFNNLIRAVEAQPDGKILLGGVFSSYNGNPVNRLIRIGSTGTLDPTFNVNPTGFVYALSLQTDGKILLGGNFLAVNGVEKFSLARVQNTAARRATPFDFDGDSKTDLSIFRSSVGEWWYNRSSDATVRAAQFGASTDKPVPADFTGDGKTDIAFFRPSTGEWFMLRSEDGSFLSFPFGASGDVPAVGDFDGDGKTDPTIYRPSTSEWFILKSTGGTAIVTFGASGDQPVPADFDGDGKADIAIFRPSDGSWWYVRSTDNQFRVFSFGLSTDKPVQGDYSGDGKADIAVYRPSTGEWFFQRSEDGSYYSLPFGAAGDIPAPGDYDGDGKFDTAVFRPNGSTWYVNRSTAGLLIQQFGLSTDTPVPSVFLP